MQYENDYVNDIRQLLFNLPQDQVCRSFGMGNPLTANQINSNGTPFWSGPKRAPDSLNFNLEDVSMSVMSGQERLKIPLAASRHAVHSRRCEFARFQLWSERRAGSSHLQEDDRVDEHPQVHTQERREDPNQRERAGRQ